MKLVQMTTKLFDDLDKQYNKCNEHLNIILNSNFEVDVVNKRIAEFNDWYTNDLSSINSNYIKTKEELENLESQYILYITNQIKSSSNTQRLLLEAIENDFNDEIDIINKDTANLIQKENKDNEKYDSRINNLENQKTTTINTQKSIRDTMINDTNAMFNNTKENLNKQQEEELDNFEKLKAKNIASIEQFKEDMESSYSKVQSLDTLN